MTEPVLVTGGTGVVGRALLRRLVADGRSVRALARSKASEDAVAAAKVLSDFAKTNDKLEIVGGAMGGTQLDAAGIKALASMPSLDELRAKIVGLVNAPATKVVQLVNAPAAKLARVFGAYAAKQAA